MVKLFEDCINKILRKGEYTIAERRTAQNMLNGTCAQYSIPENKNDTALEIDIITYQFKRQKLMGNRR